MFVPFRNLTRRAEHDWLVTGAPLMLAQGLGQFQDLNIVPEERMQAARRRLRIPPDSAPDATQLRRLAEATGGWTAVTGHVLATGDRLEIAIQAIDVPTARVLARARRDAQANADLRDVFDELTASLLEPAGVRTARVSLAALTTHSVEAYRAYLRGLDLHHRSAPRSAMAAFAESVRLDSTFALGWANLAFVIPSARGFQEIMNPASGLYRAIERASRYLHRLPAAEAAVVRSLHAVLRAKFTEARRIADSLVIADPGNLGALELLTMLQHMGMIVGRSPMEMTRDANAAVATARRLLDLDPSRRMTYSIPVTTYGFAGGLFWGYTWADSREFSSLAFMMLAVTSAPQNALVPLLQDSVVFMPLAEFNALPEEERRRLRQPGAARAMHWVEEWLSTGPDDAEAHLWASRIAELQGNYARALRSFLLADSLGIETGVENGPGRRLSLLVLNEDYDRAGAYADSLLASGAMAQRPFLAAVDRRWTYGVPALLLSRRWESAGKLARIINTKRNLSPACLSLIEEMTLVDAPVPDWLRRRTMEFAASQMDAIRGVEELAPCERAFVH